MVNLTLRGSNASVTTAAVGNVTGNVFVNGGTLTLGSGMSLGGWLEPAGTLDMGGHAVSASEIDFGWDGNWNDTLWQATVLNRGPITTGTMYVGRPVAMIAADAGET